MLQAVDRKHRFMDVPTLQLSNQQVALTSLILILKPINTHYYSVFFNFSHGICFTKKFVWWIITHNSQINRVSSIIRTEKAYRYDLSKSHVISRTVSNNIPLETFARHEEIGIGDWCVFECDQEIEGENADWPSLFKVNRNDPKVGEPIGVLGSWYSWHGRGELEVATISHNHRFKHIFNHKWQSN